MFIHTAEFPSLKTLLHRKMKLIYFILLSSTFFHITKRNSPIHPSTQLRNERTRTQIDIFVNIAADKIYDIVNRIILRHITSTHYLFIRTYCNWAWKKNVSKNGKLPGKIRAGHVAGRQFLYSNRGECEKNRKYGPPARWAKNKKEK